MDLSTLPAFELQYRIERLQAEYAACIDEDRLEEWPGFFAEDCMYQVTTRFNSRRGLPLALIYCDSRRMLVDRIVSLREANIFGEHWYRHLIGNTLVKSIDGDLLTVSSNFTVLRTMKDGVAINFAVGTYQDKVRATDTGFEFVERIVVLDTHRIDGELATPI